MKPFKFIQTGDWHIGRAFSGVGDEFRALLQHARRHLVTACARVANETGADHVLVAGDVFDTDKLADKVWQQPLRLMAQAPDLTWHIIPGNHDAYAPGGLWDTFIADAEARAPNVRVYKNAMSQPIAEGVVLLPTPTRGRRATEDPTAWMADAVTPTGVLRIGLAHGSVERGTLYDAAIPISTDAVARGKLDYLALGDWHGVTEINPRCWYAGTPETLGFGGAPFGQVLEVTIEQDAPPLVTAHRTGTHGWYRAALSNADTALADITALAEQVTQEPPDVRANARVSIVLEGDFALETIEAVRDTVQGLDAQVAQLGFDDRAARLLVTGATRAALDAALRPIADALQADADAMIGTTESLCHEATEINWSDRATDPETANAALKFMLEHAGREVRA